MRLTDLRAPPRLRAGKRQRAPKAAQQAALPPAFDLPARAGGKVSGRSRSQRALADSMSMAEAAPQAAAAAPHAAAPAGSSDDAPAEIGSGAIGLQAIEVKAVDEGVSAAAAPEGAASCAPTAAAAAAAAAGTSGSGESGALPPLEQILATALPQGPVGSLQQQADASMMLLRVDWKASDAISSVMVRRRAACHRLHLRDPPHCHVRCRRGAVARSVC